MLSQCSVQLKPISIQTLACARSFHLFFSSVCCVASSCVLSGVCVCYVYIWKSNFDSTLFWSMPRNDDEQRLYTHADFIHEFAFFNPLAIIYMDRWIL